MKQKVAIIGTGLIGGSLGLAMKQAKLDLEIVGHDKDGDAAGLAKKRGAVDKTEWNLHSAVDGAVLVIMAIPVMAIKSTLEAIASTVRPGAIITDTASTKYQVIRWAEDILPRGVHFIGGHPLAGKVGSGINDASATFFTNRVYCLMPARTASQQSLETMINLVQAIGARPFFLDPLEHDAFVAATSHLPFIAATALVRMMTQSPSWHELRRLAGVDFENASAAVAADPATYNDICQTNKEAILRWIDEYMARLAEMRSLIEQGGADLLTAFASAQEERAKWMATRDELVPDLPPLPSPEGTAGQFRQMLLGGLGRERPLPGDKKSK